MIDYAQFLERTEFSQTELIAFAYGRLITDPPEQLSRLPAPPFLMVDRITDLHKGNRNGYIIGEKNIRIDEWFFQCHFNGDPVQPGCLGVDAVWQLLGFYCVCAGSQGNGRALGCKEVNFDGQIRPYNRLVRYKIDVKRYSVIQNGIASIVIGNAKVYVDDDLIYTIEGAKVGIFKNIAYADYPNRSKNSVGGLIKRIV